MQLEAFWKEILRLKSVNLFSRYLKPNNLNIYSKSNAILMERVIKHVAESQDIVWHKSQLSINPEKEIVVFICPCYNHINYTASMLESFLEYAPQNINSIFIILDNNSSDGTEPYFKKIDSRMNLIYIRYKMNNLVTRPWNDGLSIALNSLKTDYAFLINNDILFSKGSVAALVEQCGSSTVPILVGPMTNQPGQEFQQNIRKIFPDYKDSDEPKSIEKVSMSICNRPRVQTSKLNGFFFGGRSTIFSSNFYDLENNFFFNPKYTVTHNEIEFEERWLAKGGKMFIIESSFIFHYKCVTRDITKWYSQILPRKNM